MPHFAVIDTETNWADQVMSIGVIVAECNTFSPVAAKYYVITPEYEIGGMYENELFSDPELPPTLCTRPEALSEILSWLHNYGVTDIYAYNASFDRNHLPELSRLCWHDIIRLAAYRQFNPRIPASCECFSTGRMKRNYGVEPMLRLLTDSCTYHETHNALRDAMDELEIMRLLGYRPCDYIKL